MRFPMNYPDLYLLVDGERLGAIGRRTQPVINPATGAQLGELASLYDAGQLRPVLDERTFAFDQTVEALAYVEQGKARGKVVITMDETTPGTRPPSQQ